METSDTHYKKNLININHITSAVKPGLLLAILIACFLSAEGRCESIDALLARLDSVIANEDYYVQAKQQRINDIKARRKLSRSLEDTYWSNRQLYDEYYVFDADSAMRYAMENLNISKSLNRKQWEYEWHINKSFILSVMGLLGDAKEELDKIASDSLTDDNRIKYYGQLAYLYSHIGQLADHRIIGNEDHDHISHLYEDSIKPFMKSDRPDYLWYTASACLDKRRSGENIGNLIKKLKTTVDTSAFNSRTDAMNSYILSRLYEDIGDKNNHLRYMILSGITDVKIANRDIASLNELATLLLEKGDLERAYRYADYSQKQAILLPNRVRAASLAKTVAELHHKHEKKLQSARQNLIILLIVLCIISLILAALLVMYRRRTGQLHKTQKEQEEANKVLTRQMEEISRSKSERDALITNLQAANTRNEEISDTLREANYVKEECIGATFALCSSYIQKFDNYRHEILKIAKSQKWKELQEKVLIDSSVNRELKDFYQSFDSLFLNIYPDFVSDFNKLLRPEEQISIAPGTLNTELRIYALVRLGISDSVKIASLLHCSTQTVYNYRLRMRNKACIKKERFADAVKSLGKYSHDAV